MIFGIPFRHLVTEGVTRCPSYSFSRGTVPSVHSAGRCRGRLTDLSEARRRDPPPWARLGPTQWRLLRRTSGASGGGRPASPLPAGPGPSLGLHPRVSAPPSRLRKTRRRDTKHTPGVAGPERVTGKGWNRKYPTET